ncbi:MAG: phytanoyl-CoA dioxygenase family protein [Planctomycetes bacterium]|nr:phytanoyl-CoA dioxygenase family protein [Planctomycetota bacterium]
MTLQNDQAIREWETPLALGASHVQAYQDEGVAKIKGVFSAETMDILRREVIQNVTRLGSSVDNENRDEEYPSEDVDLYRKAFTQVFNLWTHSDLIRSFVVGRLAKIAAELMGVSGVRIYHDQALIKEPGGVATPGHVDHYYWPLATEKVLTAWIPLVEITAEMGPLDFALGSHKLDYGRNAELVQQDEAVVEARLAEAGYPVVTAPYQLGEVSFHEGWNFHRAGANQTDQRREVLTVIYMDHEMTLQEPANPNQEYDREKWCPGIEVGNTINSDINLLIAAS